MTVICNNSKHCKFTNGKLRCEHAVEHKHLYRCDDPCENDEGGIRGSKCVDYFIYLVREINNDR